MMATKETIMKRGLAGLILLVLMLGAGLAAAAAATAKVKIGVYDSRGVAVAYARSAEFQQSMAQLMADHAKAKGAKDEKRLRELEQQGQWTQVRLHQRGFSTAGAADLLAKFRDALPGIAREAGVTLIVSKWEMPFSDPSVETIDLTEPLARLFQPDAATLKLLEDLKNSPPVPFDELSLDPNS